jgi:hypothetical protein
MTTSGSFRKKLLSASVASVLGLSASGPLKADSYELSFTGAFTMLNSSGAPVRNQPSPYVSYGYEYGWYGNRTPISGTITYDTVTGVGTMLINGFFFFGGEPQNIAQAHDITIQAIGNGSCVNDDPEQGCTPGNLLLGNMLFDWNFGVYPVSTVWDGLGFLGALSGAEPGDVIEATGAEPASNDLNFEGNAKLPPKFFPMGPTPIAVHTWNTTNNPACEVKDPADPEYDSGRLYCDPGVPSGILPRIEDTIGGSPIVGTSFASFSPNFDFRKLTVTCINDVCTTTPPAIFTRLPAPDAQDVSASTTISFSFTKPMQAETVVTAFSLAGPGGTLSHGAGGTLSPSSSSATLFTFTPDDPLLFTTEYTATITTEAKDTSAAELSLSDPVVWSFTTGEPTVGPTCTVDPTVPERSNFTMLSASGATFSEATNDIVYSFEFDPDNIQEGDLNEVETDNNFNMTLASESSFPFFGQPWTAHHVRVFGPGTYTFDTTCTVAQIEGGTADCNNPLGQGQTVRHLTMTVEEGQLGAHMLFNWNQAKNIDVVNVWSRNQAWNRNPRNNPVPPPLGVNDVFTGEKWGGPVGVTVNPNTIYDFVSTPANADSNYNGAPMVDGAFIGFTANFNLGPADSCLPGPKTALSVGAPSSAGGCTISRNPTAVSVLEKSEWLLIGGFLAWLGAIRRRFKRQAQS